MAKIYSKSNVLNETYRKYRSRGLYSILAFAVLILLMVIIHTQMLIPILVICMFFSAFQFNKANTYKTGIDGEQRTMEILRSLPDTYTIYTNVHIQFEEKKSEIDAVCVGPTGVFVIETKNHNGTIEGDDKDQNWTQHKVGRNGGEYSKVFFSPVKQVGTHVFRLSSVLKEQGIGKWVQGVVYFTNPEVQLRVNLSGSTPLFHYYGSRGQDLLDYIQNYKRDQLAASDLEKINNLLANTAA